AAPPYRYRLDVQEIVARRPSAVVVAAILFFFWAGSFFAFPPAIAIVLALSAPSLSSILGMAPVAIPLGLLGVVVLLIRGLLAGWRSAHWAGVVLAGAGSVLFLVVVARWLVDVATAAEGDDIADIRMSFSLLALLCSATHFIALLLPRTRA